MALRPAPPTLALSALTDVDVAADDGLVSGFPRLTYDSELGMWRPRIPGPFDGTSGTAIADIWSLGPVMPFAASPKCHMAALGGKLYIIRPTAGQSMVYDPAAGWSTIADPPSIKLGNSQTYGAIGGALVNGPNSNGAGVFRATDVYFPESDSWVTRAASPDNLGAASQVGACAGGRMVVVGRFDNTNVNIYDLALNTWDTIGNKPHQLGEVNAIGVGNRVYHFGNTASTESWAFDVATETWEQIAPLPGSGRYTNLAYSNGLIYAMSSASGGGSYAYSVAQDAWSAPGAVAPVPAVRSSCAVGNLDGRIYLAGGAASNNGSGGAQTSLYVYG